MRSVTRRHTGRAALFLWLGLFAAAVWTPAAAQWDTGSGDEARLGPSADFGSPPDSLFEISAEAYGSAPYLYALKEMHVTFEEDASTIVAVIEHHVRIKVFDASAREASLISIPYHFSDGVEEVRNLRALTHHPGGGSTALADSSVRVININARYNVMEFTMPRVSDGAVLEYAYRVRRRYIEELPEFYFAHRVPTALARVSIRYPPYLRYEATAENFDRPPSHRVEEVDTGSVAPVFTYERPDPVTVERWWARDLPALEEEQYITSLDDYRAKINFQISEFGVPRQSLENSWGFVVADLRRKRNPLERIRSYAQAEEIGGSIGARFDSDRAARDSIYRYLNERVNYSGENRPYSEMADSLVLRGEPADQAAINQTLVAMLRGAGIQAWPLMISTRESGQINRSFPSFYQFNAQLAWSSAGDSVSVMDASFAHAQPGLIPVAMYNETGLLLREKDYEWIPVQPSNSLFSIDVTLRAELDSAGNLSGELTAESDGYPKQAIRRRQAENLEAEEIFRQALFDGYSSLELTGITLEDTGSYGRPAKLSGSFHLPNYAASFTDALEFGPMIVGYLRSNPFESDRRELPVTLDAPERLNLRYEIAIPEGYSVRSGSGSRSLELDGAHLEEEYDTEGDTLRYEYRIDISQIKFRREQFPQLIRLYERWVELSNGTWQLERDS